MTRLPKLLVLVAAFAVLSLAVAIPASANDRDVRVAGTCTGASTSKLKVGPENGRLEVEFEVDQNVNGVSWRVRLTQNGDVFFRGERVTQPPSGSFEVERRTDNLPGPDTIRARAVNPDTGEVCRASATF
jgi:hypothetical protein